MKATKQKPGKRPTTIAAYIEAAPTVAQPHLRKLYAILKSVAPKAEQAMKWGMPFLVEPRFLFAFSAHKEHLSFAPMAAAMKAFAKKLEKHSTTKNMLKVRYDEPLPGALIREIARYCVREVRKRKDDSFW